MKILVSGATGFIGKNLINHFENKHKIYALGRNKNKIDKIYSSHNYNKVNAVSWDELGSSDPKDFDLVINLAGETINHLFWSEKVKKSILQSRISTTELLVNWCSNNKKIHFLNASALSIYGLYDDFPKLENTRITPRDEFLYKVASIWEKQLKQLEELNINHTIMRFAVVLSKDQGAYPKLALPAKLGLATKMGDGYQPFAWISIEDLVNSIEYIIERKIYGAVNCLSPNILSQDDFTKKICKSFNRPYLFKAPKFFIRLFLGQMGKEILLKGQYAQPEKLTSLGFKFKHNNLEDFLNS